MTKRKPAPAVTQPIGKYPGTVTLGIRKYDGKFTVVAHVVPGDFQHALTAPMLTYDDAVERLDAFQSQFLGGNQ